MKTARLPVFAALVISQCAHAQINVVRIIPSGEMIRTTPKEAKILNSLTEDSKLIELNNQVYAKRIGQTIYCVSKSLPEFQEFRDKLALLTEIMGLKDLDQIPFSKLGFRSRFLLAATLSGNRHHEISQHELVQSGKLSFLPREFVDFKSDKYGSFRVMALPDLDSLTPEQRKTFIEKQYQKLRNKINHSGEKQSGHSGLIAKTTDQADAIETTIKPEDALSGRSPYRGFEMSMNHALFSAKDLVKVHQTAIELIEEVKAVVRKECSEAADQFLPDLRKLAPEVFGSGFRSVTEKDIERHKSALRQSLEMDNRSLKEIDSILQGIKFESRSVGLVMFIKVLEPNGKIVTHTPMIKF